MDFGKSNENYGTGSYVRALPEKGVLHFRDFSGGYFALTNRESVPDNSVPYMLDFEVTGANRLKRAPGTTEIEELTHDPERMLVHGSLDFTSELIFFDPPFLGVKRFSDTVWADKELSSKGPFAWTNFGSTLIFSDGENVYARQVNDGTNITVIPDAPVAYSYESWAARMWAGGAIIDGNFEPMGLVWSAANSDYTDWTGLGSGNELLINAISGGDRIVSLKSMGLDFMAVLLRHSIWIGRRTGDTNEPGDFTARVPGIGPVNDRVVQTTVNGIMFLSDKGVELFDGNNTKHMSFQIDPDLLPLDYGVILQYHATYNETLKRYYLHCPNGTTWIYDIDFDRWYRRSLAVYESVIWQVQVEGAVVEGAPRTIFLGDQVDESHSPRVIAKEDQTSEENFGAPLTPIALLRPQTQQLMNELLTSELFNLEYAGDGNFEIWAANNAGEFEMLISDQLAPRSELDVWSLPAQKTGRLAALQLRLPNGDAEFTHLEVHYMSRGPRVEIGPDGQIGSFPDRVTLLDFPKGSTVDFAAMRRARLYPRVPKYILIIIILGWNRRNFALGDDTPPFPITSYLWDFGDGTTSTEASPNHQYTESGTYTVTCTIKNDWYTMGHYSFRVVANDAGTPVTLSVEAAAEGESGTMTMSDFIIIDSIAYGLPADNAAWSRLRHQEDPAIGQGNAGMQAGGSKIELIAGAVSAGEGFDFNASVLNRFLMMFQTNVLTFSPVTGRVKVKVMTLTDNANAIVRERVVTIDPFITAPGTLNSALRLVCWSKPSPNAVIIAENPLTDTSLKAGNPIVLASDSSFTLTTISPGDVIEFELNAAGLAFVKDNGYSNFALILINDYTGDVPIGWLDVVTPSGYNKYDIQLYSYNQDGVDVMLPTLELNGVITP